MHKGRHNDGPKDGAKAVHKLGTLNDGRIRPGPHLNQPDIIIRVPGATADAIESEGSKE